MDISNDTVPCTLTRSERLRGRGAVAKLFADGESHFSFPIRYVWCEAKEGEEVDSVLFTVPKKFHKRANRRNLLRRRIKEAYRLQKSLLPSGRPLNIALIYSTKEVLDYDRISKTIEKVLVQIGKESGRVVE